MRFRVFVDFKKNRNHINEVQKFRDVLFLGKKGPCPEGTTQKSGVGMVTRIKISRYPDTQMSRCPDIQISGIRYQISGIRIKEVKKITKTCSKSKT